MKMRSLLLLALVVSACNGTNPALPASPSALAEAPLLRTDPSSPAAPMITEMGADDFESPQDLASETTGELSVEAFFDSVLATEPDVAGTGARRHRTRRQHDRGGVTRPPGHCQRQRKGQLGDIQLEEGSNRRSPEAVRRRLQRPDQDGPPEHVVLVYGDARPVPRGACTARTTPAKVHSRPQRSPLAQAAVWTTGRSTGSGTIIRKFGVVTCRWHHTYKGTVELITDYSPKSGLVGIMKLAGSSQRSPGGFRATRGLPASHPKAPVHRHQAGHHQRVEHCQDRFVDGGLDRDIFRQPFGHSRDRQAQGSLQERLWNADDAGGPQEIVSQTSEQHDTTASTCRRSLRRWRSSRSVALQRWR